MSIFVGLDIGIGCGSSNMYVQQSSLEDGIPGLFMIPPTEDALVGFFFDMFNGKKITTFCHKPGLTYLRYYY